eukprot:5859886-Pleurochrysis_carterae.AAC.2
MCAYRLRRHWRRGLEGAGRVSQDEPRAHKLSTLRRLQAFNSLAVADILTLRLAVGACDSTFTSCASCHSSCLHAGCFYIGDEGWRAIGEGLKANMTLTSLDLSSAHSWTK